MHKGVLAIGLGIALALPAAATPGLAQPERNAVRIGAVLEPNTLDPTAATESTHGGFW